MGSVGWIPGVGVTRSLLRHLLDRVAGPEPAPGHTPAPSPSGTPTYVDYGSLMTPPAPFRSLGTTLYGFWAEVNRGRVAALCRKVFSDPSGGAVQCRPIGQHVMITWGVIDRVIAATPDYDKRGAVTEPQVAIWIPVAVREETSAQDRFAMFIPYIWLDNAISLATGRELFGYPKSWGWPELPGDGRGDGPPSWKLDVFGLNYGSDARAERHPLLEVTEASSAAGAVQADLGSLAEIARDAAGRLLGGADGLDILDDIEITASLADDLLHERMPGVFLKQFRDVRDGLGAALQQVVQTDYEIVRVHATPLLREHALTVHPLDSHPVIDELGLETQTLGLAYRVEMDFNVGGGRVLWDAAMK
jgi:hypothetical protein